MNQVWAMSMDDYLNIVERAQKEGVKPGESMAKQMKEYMEEKNIKPIANTELTKDEFIAEQVSHDKKIFEMRNNKEGDTEYRFISPKNETGLDS